MRGSAAGEVMPVDPLLRRLESTAAVLAGQLAEALAAYAPASGAVARSFAAGVLAATGPGRYVNRAVGISLDDPGDDGLDEVEAFYADRGLPAVIEVISLAPRSLLERLAARGYTVAWIRDLYARPLTAADAGGFTTDAEVVVLATRSEWVACLADGNEITEPGPRAISDEFAWAASTTPDRTDVMLRRDDTVAGCGSLETIDGVGWVGAAATRVEHRRAGVQSTLLRHRFALAYQLGCDTLAATALPDGTSARNLRRHGFTLQAVQAVMVKPG